MALGTGDHPALLGKLDLASVAAKRPARGSSTSSDKVLAFEKQHEEADSGAVLLADRVGEAVRRRTARVSGRGGPTGHPVSGRRDARARSQVVGENRDVGDERCPPRGQGLTKIRLSVGDELLATAGG